MPTQIDTKTNLFYQIKRPAPETRLYSIDFKKLCPGITSIESITVSPRGLVPEEDALVTSEHSFTGTIVYFRASGGTDKEDYEIKIELTDTLNNVISEDIMLKVRIAGKLP